MMKLSVMKNFFEMEKTYVYQLLERWGPDKDSLRFLRASSNFIFTFEKEGEKYILRITPEGDWEKINQELLFLSYLKDHPVTVNQPVQSYEGNLIESIHTPMGALHGVVVQFLQGNLKEIEELNDEEYVLWGEALGNLHHLSRLYHEKETSTLINLLSPITVQDALEQKEYDKVSVHLNSLKRTSQNYGRIHFDFELDNLIWAGKEVQIIDFEGSLSGWFAADIAFALRDLFSNDVDLSNKNFQLFIQGYRTKMEISEEEINHIPMFIRFHNYVTYDHLKQVVDVQINEETPEWLAGLVNKLEQKIEGYRATFG
ncbi:phosphotransferase [Bacillus sp. 31A1R]|uniref:Phosphotransferase n=1 Tax=Robertmurraya mangrovi TaxID=3098077 RepID=A0ABU5IVY9_9BACI|nr:phosphotransferase [Bacillus sp. 31A1R]MDZ5471295.1 phosphotransferase [Bacillus sp. 31A1R]